MMAKASLSRILLVSQKKSHKSSDYFSSRGKIVLNAILPPKAKLY